MRTEAARAAAEIRKELKKNGIKAKVRSENYSMGSSVNIDVTDLLPATLAEVEAFCDQYQYGHFNGMEDMYEHTNSRDDIPQAKYVFVRHNLSDRLRDEAWQYMKARYADIKSASYVGAGWDEIQAFGRWLDDSGFWATKKPRLKTLG